MWGGSANIFEKDDNPKIPIVNENKPSSANSSLNTSGFPNLRTGKRPLPKSINDFYRKSS